MSIASQDTYLNLTTPLSVVGSGGGGGGGVDAVISGANISTIGASVGDVTVALQADLTNINSVGFSVGGAVSGLSTINGLAVGSVNPDLVVSTLFAKSTIQVGLAPSVELSDDNNFDPANPAGIISFNGTRTTALCSIFASGTNTANAGPFDIYANPDDGGTRIKLSAGGPTVSGVSTGHIYMQGIVDIAALATVSSVNGVPYPTAPPANATFSTLGLSSIGAIVPAAAGSVQTFNTVIGNMRLQGGVVSTTSAGTAVTWATAFTSIPIILTGCTGLTGSGTAPTQIGGGETGATFSVNTGATTEVYWLAIGAA